MAQSDSSEWQRNDKKSKNFQCPCGKSYLSYPALYTHIKQAHGGKAPGQIKRPDSHNRGRPKTAGNSKIQQHNKFIEQALKADPIPQLMALMEDSQVSKNRSVKQIYENQPVFKLIMNDKDKPLNPKYLKQDRIYDVKMGEGIIQFLKEIQNRIENKNAYDQIVMLVVLLTQHIIEQTEDQNVLNLGTIGLMPEFVNYFIIHDFKKPVQRLKLQDLWVFQDRNAIKVFNLFFKWMLFKKYTLTKVQINEKYLNPDQYDSDNIEDENDDQNNEQLNDEQGNEKQNDESNNDNSSDEQNNQLQNDQQNDQQSDSLDNKKQQKIEQINDNYVKQIKQENKNKQKINGNHKIEQNEDDQPIKKVKLNDDQQQKFLLLSPSQQSI